MAQGFFWGAMFIWRNTVYVTNFQTLYDPCTLCIFNLEELDMREIKDAAGNRHNLCMVISALVVIEKFPFILATNYLLCFKRFSNRKMVILSSFHLVNHFSFYRIVFLQFQPI